MSQNRLARLAQIDPAYINRMARSPIAPTREIVLAIANALGLVGPHADRLLWAAGLAPDHDYIAEVLYYREAFRAINQALKETQKYNQNLHEGG